MKEILRAENISVEIKNKEIIRNLNLSIDKGKIYSIIGPNGSGKTTLLRVLSRNLKPKKGKVLLKQKNIFKLNTKTVARTMAVLSQTNNGMTDVTVRNLIVYGRYAHKEWWRGKSNEDKKIVDWAIERTNLKKLEKRKLNTLSGGERQRAWIAMAIAQGPEILLLDEPTTFLDISHQLEVLELVSSLNKENDITILMVLHDINQAARYSDEIIVIKDGELYKQDNPWNIVNDITLKKVFKVQSSFTKDLDTGKPIFYPKKVI